MEKKFWTAADLQKQTGLGRSAVYALMNRADFPSVRLGNKRVIVPVDDFFAWIEKERQRQKGEGIANGATC